MKTVNQYKTVTAELVKKTKELNRRFPDMNAREMERITGWVSDSTFCKILNGKYDYLLEDEGQAPDVSSDSNLMEELRTFRERYMQMSQEQAESIMDVLMANNHLLADIATMLVNLIECPEHRASKASEAHFRDKIKSNRR